MTDQDNTTLVPVNLDTGEFKETEPTHIQARANSVGMAMIAAMGKASMLELTDEQIAKLKADFPNEAFRYGAAGKDNLIYIEHVALRNRLDDALGMGKWTLVRTRPHWVENYEVYDSKTNKLKPAHRVYADCALVVMGCYVAEAIGDMSYFPDNASMNFGDAAEGAMTQALRRCAKQFGVGLQAWSKTWTEDWTSKHPKQQGSSRPTTSQQRQPTQVDPNVDRLDKLLDEISGMTQEQLTAFCGTGDVWKDNQATWNKEYGKAGQEAIKDRIKVRGQILKTLHKPVDTKIEEATFTPVDTPNAPLFDPTEGKEEAPQPPAPLMKADALIKQIEAATTQDEHLENSDYFNDNRSRYPDKERENIRQALLGHMKGK